MNSISTLATFFGWCTVLNVTVLILVVALAAMAKDWVAGIHARIFGVSLEEAKAALLRVYLHYRIAIVIFNFIPYIALKIMA